MSDFDVNEYLLSYAPLARFYLFFPPGGDDVLIKFFDEAGRSWNIMEDDESVVANAVAFLSRLNARTFQDHAELLAYELEVSRISCGRP